MKMKISLVFFVCLLGACTCQKRNTGDQEDDASEKAFDIVQKLYITLRNIAFPQHKLSGERGIENRFLLMMPGKILNYFDYYPGKEYTNFIQNPDATTKEAVVPPHVMEKWFDLADVVPTPNPMNGQDTGRSLAEIYTSILHEIKVEGLKRKTNNEKAVYNRSVSYLNEMVIDPENTSAAVPRLTLYERYRDLYNDRKLDMEDTIEIKRKTYGFLDYELWFQRHYPSLQAKVESAYTKWMIFGEKENVELYITYLDTGSSAQVLEEARMALRAAGVSSLDRTRTIYPVSFEPSDWYKYLLPKTQKPSRDQLLAMLGKVKSKIGAIDVMMNSNTSGSSGVDQLQANYRTAQRNVQRNLTDHMNNEISCLTDPTGNGSECQNYEKSREVVIEGLLQEAQAFSTYEHVNYYYDYKNDYIAVLQKMRADLDAQARALESLLGQSSPFLGGILDASPLTVATIQDTYKDDEWLQFDFDSESFDETADEEKTSISITRQMHFHFLFFGGGGTHTYNKNTYDYSDHLAKSRMRVKGELLRVYIKRPWLKPQIFDDPSLDYSESDNKGSATYVAPGRQLTEVQFYKSLLSDNLKYKLPEYTTSFLLARNIELDFSGLDSDTTTSLMDEMSHTSGGGGFLFFHASISETKTKQTSHVEVKRSANGMSIKIPGAQVIGYYTETLPKFPLEQQ